MVGRTVLIAMAAAVAAQETELVISVGTQNGFFKSNPSNPSLSGDIGPMK